MDKDTLDWLRTLGLAPGDVSLFERALTHSSFGEAQYERLEFLGDRVLGLTVAAWLYELFPEEPEGQLSKRLNALVARETCAEVGRTLGVGDRIRLGKQAREDGASDSDNVIGDVVESLIGAIYIDSGLEAAEAFVRSAWGDRVSTRDKAPQHPKSALQEWAAANNRRPPAYALKCRKGPDHSPRFVVTVEVRGIGAADGEGGSK
ncbi:MAG TPA: ribonuclease III, partial [Allosphingosinicella sp.]